MTFWGKEAPTGTLTGEEAKRFLARGDRAIFALSVLLSPLTALVWILVKIHNGLEWLLSKLLP